MVNVNKVYTIPVRIIRSSPNGSRLQDITWEFLDYDRSGSPRLPGDRFVMQLLRLSAFQTPSSQDPAITTATRLRQITSVSCRSQDGPTEWQTENTVYWTTQAHSRILELRIHMLEEPLPRELPPVVGAAPYSFPVTLHFPDGITRSFSYGATEDIYLGATDFKGRFESYVEGYMPGRRFRLRAVNGEKPYGVGLEADYMGPEMLNCKIPGMWIHTVGQVRAVEAYVEDAGERGKGRWGRWRIRGIMHTRLERLWEVGQCCDLVHQGPGFGLDVELWV